MKSPTVNAGSMADIAFLLLIFFLVTTTIPNDEGIQQKLPQECEECPPPVTIHDRNILEIVINKNNQLLADDQVVTLNEIKNLAKQFIDNNGRDPELSETPQEAVISLQSDRETSYKVYVSVLNELKTAYAELRTTYAKHNYKKSMGELTETQLKAVKEAYPQLLSEASTQ